MVFDDRNSVLINWHPDKTEEIAILRFMLASWILVSNVALFLSNKLFFLTRQDWGGEEEDRYVGIYVMNQAECPKLVILKLVGFMY